MTEEQLPVYEERAKKDIDAGTVYESIWAIKRRVALAICGVKQIDKDGMDTDNPEYVILRGTEELLQEASNEIAKLEDQLIDFIGPY